MRGFIRGVVLCVSLLLSAVCAQAQVTSYQGLWWAAPAGSESGWGINFTHQGDVIFATWFTYDANGRPLWFSSTMQQTGTAPFIGNIYKTTGPVFSATPFDPSQVTASVVGTTTVTFNGPATATFTYTVGGVTRTKTITPQVFRSAPTCKLSTQASLTTATNYQGLWWATPAASESGWGINFAHQEDVIFATWFTYDTDKEPLWLTGTFERKTDGGFVGDLYRTKGPSFDAVPFNPSLVTATKVGTATLRFSSGINGTFAYTVNGITQTKTITQQLFRDQVTVCAPTPPSALTLFGVADSFFGGSDTTLSFPYSMTSTVSANVICMGTGCSTVYDIATFKLRASGRSYTITNLQATGSPVTPLFSGLSNGQTIADGQTVTFKLQSPFTRGATASLTYFFTVLETSQTFRYAVQLRTN